MSLYVTVSRQWTKPEIKELITNDGISLHMKLEDFKEALKLELGSPKFVVRKKKLSEKIDLAFVNIITGIKEESKKVVS